MKISIKSAIGLAGFPLTDKAIIPIPPVEKATSFQLPQILETQQKQAAFLHFWNKSTEYVIVGVNWSNNGKEADSSKFLQRLEANLASFAKATDDWNQLEYLFYEDRLQCGDSIRLFVRKQNTSGQEFDGIEAVIWV